METHLSDAELVKRALPLFTELVRRQLLQVCASDESFLSGNPPAPFVTCHPVTGANPNGPCIDLWIEEGFPIEGRDEDLPIREPGHLQ